jgi:DNA-directed RNA polymerase specialized sigma24 family protein
MRTTLAAQLRLLKDGAIGFTDFARATKDDWKRMAKRLYGRWRLPAGVTEEDVEQEMLLHAWIAVQNYEPDRGVQLFTHVVWCAHSSAKKWLHTQRKAKRRGDGAPSRHARSVSGMGVNSDGLLSHDEVLDLFGCVEAEQERAAEWQGIVRDLPLIAPSPSSAGVLRAWVQNEGDVEGAAVDVYADASLRLDYEIDSDADAQRVVRREVRKIAEYMAEN